MLIVAQLGIFKNEIEIKGAVQEEKINEVEDCLYYLYDWQIRIPKINLIAPIKNGTSKENLDEFVGHFEETVFQNGNVGLAAHNRGYPVNYFENIKLLENGDEIYYLYQGKEIKYIVNFKGVIDYTNWDYLKSTEDNRITLITCVENKPKYRLCVQAVEVEENKNKINKINK